MFEIKAYHHKNLKEELIEKSLEIIGTDGIKALSLRKVANECGVSHSAPYSHFKNKDELLKTIQEYITNQFSEVLKNAINISEDIDKQLLYLGKAYLLFFMENPYYFSFLYFNSDIKINLSLYDDNFDNYEPFEIYKEVALKFLQAKNFKKEEFNDRIITMWATVHGLTSLAIMSNIEYKEKFEEKIFSFLENC